MRHGIRSLAALAVMAATLAPLCAAAQDAASFYRGKNVTLVIGTGPGGAYDIHGRLLARHLGAHIPGAPHIVVQNIPGAGSVQAANYVFNVAPQDGTVIGNLLNTVPLVQALGQVKTQFDVAQFQWVGNMTEEVYVVVVRKPGKIESLDQAKATEVVMGATSPGALSGMFPKVVNLLIGTQFRVVAGYNDAVEIDHAMELGEVEGRAGETWYGPDKGVYGQWYTQGKIRLLLQIGPHKAPDLANVPVFSDLAPEGEGKQIAELFTSPAIIGKPTVAGPRVPAYLVAALRQAYADTMKDPEFRADAEKLGVNVEPVSGEALGALVTRVTHTPDALLARLRELVN